MSSAFVCKACGLERERNYRLGNKEQQYCRNRDCQRARRREYQRNRLQSQPIYRQKQRNCQIRWRRHEVSFAKYQQAYRENHPEYTAKNRQQQQQRNTKRRQKVVSQSDAVPMPDPVIVKMNSCNSVKLGTYHITLTQGQTLELIVKMNSCSLDFSTSSVAAIAAVRLIVSDSMASAREICDIPTQKFVAHYSVKVKPWPHQMSSYPSVFATSATAPSAG